MNAGVDWSKLEGKYWKPDTEVQYIVEFANWRIEEKRYEPSESPRPFLVLDVLNAGRDPGREMPEIIYYAPPKLFTTGNQSFLQSIRGIIERAVQERRDSIIVVLRKTGEGKKVQYSITDAGYMKQFRGGSR